LDEDEAAAKAALAASAADWWLDSSEERDERSVRYTAQSTLNPLTDADYYIADRVATADAEHIVRHDPAQVLRWVNAGRAAVRFYEETLEVADPIVAATALGTLDGLATIYSDHPDYRDEWKPGGTP